jgi:ABC-2 type transport system permease protein
VDRFAASGRFLPRATSQSVEAADEAMLDRDVDVILVIPQDFEEELVRRRQAPVQLILNAEDGAAAAVVQTYANEVLARYAAELLPTVNPFAARLHMEEEPAPQPGRPLLEVRRRGRYNPQLDYRDYMVPGILVVLVTMIGTLLTAMNVVREKEAGTLEQLNVTPISRPDFIAAKLIPIWTFAMIDFAVGLAFARFALGVPVRGSLLLVFASATIYLVMALGIGLWISTFVETQQQALFLTYSLLLVYLLMSGLFTPVRAMPDWAQWIARLNPVAHYVKLMREVLLKGAGVMEVAPQLAALTGGAAIALTLAVRQYHKRSG